MAKTQQYIFLGITKVAPMPSLLHDHLPRDDLKETTPVFKEGMKQHWGNKAQLGCGLGVFASEIPPVGLCPGFDTVCKWQEQKWAMEVGTNQKGQTGAGVRFWQVLCLLTKQVRVRSPSANQTVVLAQGVTCSPPTLPEAGDKALALVRLPGKKLYTKEEIIFHPPAGQLVLGSVLCLRFEDLQTDKLHNPAKVSLNIRQINSTFSVSTTPIYGAPFSLSFA